MSPTDSREIRPAESGDRPALSALQATLPEPTPALLSAGLDGGGIVLVSADARDRPVGYLLAVPGRDAAHVAEVAVAPEHRREGRASALLAALFARLAGDVRTVRLAVAPDNDAANACYRGAGFRVVDRDPSYFDGGPALLMERPLEETGQDCSREAVPDG